MLIAFWIVNVLAALVFIAAGGMKTVRSKEAIVASGLTWAEDFSRTAVRLIGVAELLGGLGLVLPVLTGVAPVLTPIAAAGLTVIMIGAVVVHVRRRETPLPAAVLAALAAVSTVLSGIVVFG
ncbi:DoxX family protein [Microbacterium betulae]|uniref:DoxX family protein n=1 Tax=Microbacterium betulae TaxID=2981139 RepID=A0AA97FHJ6_9MICO|nr:DoxX family protein [Microbacterium sp. AB]WOF22430.1 DoxX family protein [Microbacterium sp. AB]